MIDNYKTTKKYVIQVIQEHKNDHIIIGHSKKSNWKQETSQAVVNVQIEIMSHNINIRNYSKRDRVYNDTMPIVRGIMLSVAIDIDAKKENSDCK